MIATRRRINVLLASLGFVLAPSMCLAQAELFLQFLDSPNGPFQQGQTFTIDSLVNNFGDVASGPYTLTFYASDDFEVSEDDVVLASVERENLAASSSDDSPVTAAIPFSLPAGEYFVVGFIDFDDMFPENNRNFDASPLTVIESNGSGVDINAGHNGNWWSGLSRDGEGAQVEVADAGGGLLVFVVTIYTYAPQGGQIFLIGVGFPDGDSVEIELFITSGGDWGAALDPAQTPQTPWGTGVVTSNGCDGLTIAMTPNAEFQAMGYTMFTLNLQRLTTSAIPCPYEG
ncbi:MAG: hypothetical protein R3212_10510 [Xanthomonadales bacterium]|nr:hypothetical protein [Xanthomonadales bacterium]